MKSCGLLVPVGDVTVTSTGPTACAGVVKVSELPLAAMVSGVIGALPSTETVLPAVKSLPVIVTTVPPTVGPLSGAMPVVVGAGTGGAM